MDKKSLITVNEEDRVARIKDQILHYWELRKRGQDVLCEMAQLLNEIKTEELYQDFGSGCETFDKFVESQLKMSRQAASNIIKAGETIATLEEAKIKNIPDIQEQLLLLHRIPEKDRAKVWKAATKYLSEENKPQSTANIKKVVEAALNEPQRERPGVNAELSIDEEDNGDSEPAARTFSEDGEWALDKIGRIAGEAVKRDILNGSIQISDRDLERWANERPETIKSIAYYMDHRWSFKKALSVEESAYTQETNLDLLTNRALASGGKLSAEFGMHNVEWKLILALQKMET